MQMGGLFSVMGQGKLYGGKIFLELFVLIASDNLKKMCVYL